MKITFCCFLLIISNTIAVFAQCEFEPRIELTGKVLAAREFTARNDSRARNEMILTLEAAAKNSSWATANAESAVLTIFADGRYSQDVMLYGGAEKFSYRVALGSFEPGAHQIKIVFNQARSAKNVKQAKIYAVNITSADATKKDSADVADDVAAANAPIIYARPDTIDKFSDVPLITYYEVFPTGENAFKIRYTTIFTNEDGGTQSAALLARWGRLTDIEWIYEIEWKNGAIVSEIYQGANHAVKKYAGGRVLGVHPLFLNATVNNNFADAGCSLLRFAPLAIRADLSSKSRETVMDENPWTYQIMAREAIREGRVNALKLDANTVADPRDYVYAEIRGELENAAIALEAETPDGAKISSDAGKESLRVNRNGFVRIALRLPAEFSGAAKLKLNIGCYKISRTENEKESICRTFDLLKIVRLDENYLPREEKFQAKTQTLKAGETANFAVFNPR